MRRPVNRHRRGPDQKRNDAVRRQFQIDREPIERGPSPLPGRSLSHSEMCCQDRASASIFFHSSALSWSFLAAMFSSRCATDDVPGIGNMTGKPPIWSKNCSRKPSEFEELIFPDEIHDL